MWKENGLFLDLVLEYRQARNDVVYKIKSSLRGTLTGLNQLCESFCDEYFRHCEERK